MSPPLPLTPVDPLAAHPTVRAVSQRQRTAPPEPLDAAWLRELCLKAGADDVGFVRLDRPELDGQREEIRRAFPPTRTLISFVTRMNRENIRSPARSTANAEFHHATGQTDDISHAIVRALEDKGVRAFFPPAGFPMEMDREGKPWVVSHKPVAVAAGLGVMGIHRNVIHPRFGNFVLLGTVLVGADIAEQTQPLDFSPCLSCKLCVAACPVGAIGADGHFDFSACYTHNYREFLGGFSDWVETVVESRDRTDYRSRVTHGETLSVWQSLGYGPNYKAAYCLAVCPAGEDVISPFLRNKKEFIAETVRPLQQKSEPVYVVRGSDAEAHVRKRFPHKIPRRVHNGLTPHTVAAFVAGLPLAFQRGQAGGLDVVYHFIFSGKETAEATVIIRNRTLQVKNGLTGRPNLRVAADSETWIRFLNRETNIIWPLLRRKIRLRGSPRLLLAFGKCFPS